MRKLVLLLLLLPPFAAAQAPPAAPAGARVEFENERVRILRGSIAPGARGRVHTHPSYIGIPLTDARLRIHFPDGTTREMHVQAGQPGWREGVTHAIENLGQSVFEAIDVELKDSATHAGPPLSNAAAHEPESVKLEFENEHVLRYRLRPGQKGKTHGHPAFVAVLLTDANLRVTLADGTTRESNAKAGEASWHEPVTHTIENLGPKPFEALAIELKRDPRKPTD